MGDCKINNRILLGIFDEFKNEFGMSNGDDSKSFEKLVNYVILSKIDPTSFADPDTFDYVDVDVDGKKSTFGIDAFALIINDHLITKISEIDSFKKSNRMDIRFIFIQTKCSSCFDSGDLLKFTTAVKNFFSAEKSSELTEQLQEAKDKVELLFKPEIARIFSKNKPICELFFATSGGKLDVHEIKIIIENEEKEIAKLVNELSSVKIKHIDADYILDSYNEIQNSYRVNIEFKNNIPCEKIKDVEQSYIGYLPTSEFLKLIVDNDGNIRKNLFYENVRDFQGTDNSVNAEIILTLEDNNLIDKFVLLNNGITIVTKDFRNLRSNEYEISDYYIVNGCQTSNVIYNFREKIKNYSSLYIPIKLIHTTSNELITKLIKSTNRQTPVPDEAFVSLQKFHKRLQDFYNLFPKDIAIKLYYERRSKEYNSSNNKIERPRIINLHYQIKAFTSVMLGDPQLVYANNPSSILKQYKNKIFAEEHKYTPYFLSALYVYLFSTFILNKKIDKKYNIPKFWICWIANSIRFKSFSVNNFNSKYIDEKCNEFINELSDHNYALELFQNAINVFDNAQKQHEKEYGKKKILELTRLKTFKNIVKQNLNFSTNTNSNNANIENPNNQRKHKYGYRFKIQK